MAATESVSKSGASILQPRSAGKSVRRRDPRSGRDVSLNGSSLGGPVKGEENAPPQQDSYPLIFKCAQCDAIFGDSTAWVRDDQQMKTITISHKTKRVEVCGQLIHSEEGADVGCSYKLIKCARCQLPVGRVYQTTARHMDDLRDVYTYDVDRIDSYEIGKTDSYQNGQTDVASLVPQSLSDSQKLPHARYLISEIRKVQATIVSLDERVTGIEEVLSVNPLHADRGTRGRCAAEVTWGEKEGGVGDMMSPRSDGSSASKRGKLA